MDHENDHWKVPFGERSVVRYLMTPSAVHSEDVQLVAELHRQRMAGIDLYWQGAIVHYLIVLDRGYLRPGHGEGTTFF